MATGKFLAVSFQVNMNRWRPLKMTDAILPRLSARDREVILECLRAVAHGPFIHDYEISVFFYPHSREWLQQLARRVPDLDDRDPEVRRALGWSLCCLVNHPHGRLDCWDEWISVDWTTVDNINRRWLKLLPPLQYARMEVYGPAQIEGMFYRVIAYWVRNGGEGLSGQVWRDGKWCSDYEGPGCRAIMAAPVASPECLASAGVDGGPLSPDYDPNRDLLDD